MSACLKRLGMELTDLITQCGPVRVERIFGKHHSENRAVIAIHLDDLEITFILDDSYPFSPPFRILVNGRDYIHILTRSNKIFSDIGRRLNYPACFCCESVICRNNWSPSRRLSIIYDEIRGVIYKKLHILHIHYCRKIALEKLTHDIPLEDYL